MNNIDNACVTETWLESTVPRSVINTTDVIGGGICVCIRDTVDMYSGRRSSHRELQSDQNSFHVTYLFFPFLIIDSNKIYPKSISVQVHVQTVVI